MKYILSGKADHVNNGHNKTPILKRAS